MEVLQQLCLLIASLDLLRCFLDELRCVFRKEQNTFQGCSQGSERQQIMDNHFLVLPDWRTRLPRTQYFKIMTEPTKKQAQQKPCSADINSSGPPAQLGSTGSEYADSSVPGHSVQTLWREEAPRKVE